MNFPPEDFDAWAGDYDGEVAAQAGFPFEGYARMMDAFLERGKPKSACAVLDLGSGTGNLGGMFLQQGCRVWGVDFSPKMTAIARRKFPEIRCFIQDVREPLPAALPERFDLIVSAYVFHHFPITEKVRLLRELAENHLLPHGKLLIGDILFSDIHAREETARKYPHQWDEEEFWVLDRDLPFIHAAGLTMTVETISFCAGLMEFKLQGA